MKTLRKMIGRNAKMFFKDKGIFFTSLITPLILLVLYATFLANVYRDSFLSALPEGVTVADKLIDATVGGQLFSSLLAVSCVTVAFCSNMLMVQDKVTGARDDLAVSPVKSWKIAVSYYVSTTISTLIVAFVAMGACFIYLACVGWYLRFSDVMFLVLDVFLLVSFGTALSSVINFFLSSQGQISAVGSIVSAVYGFICGAYMPISQFSDGLQKVISFLPGTYGTSLLRNHALNGAFAEMSAQGFPAEVVKGIRDSIDCNLYFFGNAVPVWVMYLILVLSVAILLGVYIALNVFAAKKKK